jgi:hypothetical protein
VIDSTKYIRLSRLSGLLGQQKQVNVLGIVVTADGKDPGHFRISDISRRHTAPINVQGIASDGKVSRGDCILLYSFTVCNDSTGLPFLRKMANDNDQGSLCIWKVGSEGFCADCGVLIGKEEMFEMIRLHNWFNKHKDPLTAL